MSPQFQVYLNTSLQILKNSSLQFLCFFGMLFVSGITLTLISRWTQNSFQQFKFPNFGLYAFGVVGIPIHELCHAIFAKVFFHDIKSIKWFDPSGKGGSYGAVTHYYNDKNLYHRIGLFFIGMGPVLLAPVFLYAIYHWLVPGAVHFEFSVLRPTKSLEAFASTFLHPHNWRSVGFYVFLYLTICLTSQMELSEADFQIARGGIFPFFVLILVANLLAFLFKINLSAQVLRVLESSFFIWASFFAIAVAISLINFVLCVFILGFINRIMGSSFINPFKS